MTKYARVFLNTTIHAVHLALQAFLLGLESCGALLIAIIHLYTKVFISHLHMESVACCFLTL